MGFDGRPSARTVRHTSRSDGRAVSVSATCASAIVRSWALRRESASGSSVSGERRAPGLLGADVSGFSARRADRRRAGCCVWGLVCGRLWRWGCRGRVGRAGGGGSGGVGTVALPAPRAAVSGAEGALGVARESGGGGEHGAGAGERQQ